MTSGRRGVPDTDDLALWRAAAARLGRGEPTVLVSVVDHEGSVPGVTGARMVVGPDGSIGTVGGGVAEAAMLEAARTMDERWTLHRFRHDGPGSSSMCSGTQVFALLELRLALSQLFGESLDRHP